jgi:hypothetical protein
LSVSRRTALTRPTPAGARSTARDKVGTECRSGSFSDPKPASAATTVMNRKLNFLELRHGEVRRIPKGEVRRILIPGTWVNSVLAPRTRE